MGVKKACIFKANSLGSYIVTRANSLLDRQLKIDSESSDYLLLVQSHGDNHRAIYIIFKKPWFLIIIIQAEI